MKNFAQLSSLLFGLGNSRVGQAPFCSPMQAFSEGPRSWSFFIEKELGTTRNNKRSNES